MEFLSLPEGKHVELQTSNSGPASGPCEKNDAWDALDPMTLSDVELASDACIRHLEHHGCALVHNALSPDTCQKLKAFVDEKLSRVQRSLEEASEEERSNLEREWLGSVRDRQHRWDLKLSLSPCVWDALQEVVQNLHPFLEGTVELEAPLVELACLISDPGAPRQNVHVDTGGWKTACAPLLTVFVSLQETAEDMGPTMLFPGTHDDPYLQQWLSVLPGADRTPEQFGAAELATGPAGTALLMNSRLLHCGGENQSGRRRRLFYMTWQKPQNTNHGSTYSLHHSLAGRWRLLDFLRCGKGAAWAPTGGHRERIALEIEAKKKDDPQAMLEFALCLRREKDPGAVEWLRATGRKGHPLACMHLAEMYCLGELGLETNLEAAEELRRFALGIFEHLVDPSEKKPSFQEFLESHASVFKQELLF